MYVTYIHMSKLAILSQVSGKYIMYIDYISLHSSNQIKLPDHTEPIYEKITCKFSVVYHHNYVSVKCNLK